MAHSSTVRRHPFPSASSPSSPSSSSSSSPLPLFSSHNKNLIFPLKPLSSLSFLSFSPYPSLSPARVSTAPLEWATAPESEFDKEIQRLEILWSRLSDSPNLEARLCVLDADSRVRKFFGTSRVFSSHGMDPYEIFLLKCLVAAGQEHVLAGSYGALTGKGGGGLAELRKLASMLGEVERFYDCIGGVIGYQILILELLSRSKSERQIANWSHQLDETMNYQFKEIHVPGGVDLAKNREYASQAALWGIEGLEMLGEIYPLGGSGDRLGLVDPITGECLPAAMLPYCGRTLLEGLIRDLQAREFLYYKLYGKQCITPVAIMTSGAKNNHQRIMALCEKLRWFGRGRLSFQLFEQPLVPAVGAEDGCWLVSKPFTPVCKPGGHGVIWKLAYDKGIFQWFYSHGRKGVTVRQVSNVVAATDLTLLALAGIGLHNRKKLGFASCEQKIGATEGINVLIEKKNLDGQWAYGLTCIEYTEFEKFGITSAPLSPNSLQAKFPANTNILYVDLAAAEKVGLSKNATSLPGMVLNLKKPIVYVDHLGMRHSVSGGRLECTMQNIADEFVNTYSSRHYKDVEEVLDTFIVYNERKKVTSSAKKKRRHADKSLHQTPDGSLLDIIRNASDLLSHCDVQIPKIEDNNKYIQSGPPFLILLHPALGPLWEITRQKFHGGSISEGSELQLEVAEFLWRDVKLDGSLLVLADNVIGSTQNYENNDPLLEYGYRCGRCKLQNVKILNEGIDWKSPDNIYWKHDVKRIEMLKIVLHGNAEFEAADVVLQGNHVFEVPDGHRLQVTSGSSGLSVKLDPIKPVLMDSGSWYWKYKLNGAHIQLEMVEL